jgi:hypothetical protein
MNSISDIKIIGIDEERPPRIRKAAYIDLYFKLSTKPPTDWCDDFNALAHKIEPAAKIDKIKGNVIETWVREMDLIPGHLEKIKKTVTRCNQQYMEKALKKQLAAALKDAAVVGMDGQQNRLNEIITALNFDTDDTATS